MLKHLLVTVFAAIALGTYAQKNELSMLNDRFFFTFPDSAKNIARATNIMSADPNTNKETRIVLDVGNKRMVVFAEDLLVKAGDDLLQKLQAQNTKEYPVEVKQVMHKDSITIIAVTPTTFDAKHTAILINRLFIVNPDRTVSRVSFYLNPEAYTDKPNFDKITAAVIGSFRKGLRRLQLASHKEVFNILGTNTKMEIDVPADYVVAVDKKYDFEVYQIIKVTNYGERKFGRLSVYYGFHPSFFSAQLEMNGDMAEETNGEFMFQHFKWLNFKDEKRNLLVREQMFVDDDILKNANIHIAMVSGDPGVIEELTAIVKGILLKYDK